jgi:hypothetical protein
MQPGEPHLSIDYGTAWTQVVLVWPDGRWEPLAFDGMLGLSNAVHTDAEGRVVVGETAWRQATVDADGFIPAPLSHLNGPDEGTVAVRGARVPVADLVVATLRHVAATAAARVGGPVGDVRMVVPAGWGPRRRTWLRRVAHRAGLGQPRLAEAPVAAAQQLLAVGVQVPVGSFLLFCDLGAGCEATVLRRGPAGFEVLSTVADPHAGATAIGDRLYESLAAADAVPAPGSPGRWAAVHSLRAAREALARQTVVTVPMPPPTPPVVLHAAVADAAAEPVLKQAGTLATQAVTAAELTADQLTGSYLIGGAADMPAAASVIGAQLGAAPQSVTQPGFAAVLGATDATPTGTPGAAGVAGPAADAGEQRVPPLRRLFGIALPGMASLALFCHMVYGTEFNNGTPDRPRYGYYILTVWGELTLAAVFALIAWLAAAVILGTVLAQAQHRDGATTHTGGPGRIAGGITLAVTAGLAVAALYGVAAAAYFAVPVEQPLRWALLPALPTAAVVAAVAWVARRPIRPPQGWDTVFTFPVSSVLCATAGALMFASVWASPIPPGLMPLYQTLMRGGALLVGVGAACALVRHLGLRLVFGFILGVFGVFMADAGGFGILAVTYALAVTAWAAYRLWLLLRLPTGHAHAR